MTTPAYRLARFICELLACDPKQIRIGRQSLTDTELQQAPIVINMPEAQTALGQSEFYDGEQEQMHYSALSKVPVVLSFYGESAYERAKNFTLLLHSEKSIQLQFASGLALFNVSGITAVEAAEDPPTHSHFDLNFTLSYSETAAIETLRIDAAKFHFLT